MYLIDTNVISEARKGDKANAGVRSYFRGALDKQIAATAWVRGLTLVTRNTKDFQAPQVRGLNPFVSTNGP